jgi:hypothetical protein
MKGNEVKEEEGNRAKSAECVAVSKEQRRGTKMQIRKRLILFFFLQSSSAASASRLFSHSPLPSALLVHKFCYFSFVTPSCPPAPISALPQLVE